MNKLKQEITVVFSGNGESSCLAVDKKSFDIIKQNRGRKFLDEDRERLYKDNYRRLKNDSSLYDVDDFELLRLLPEPTKDIVGYKAMLILEPLSKEDIQEGYFD